jgi:amylosucrase
MPERDVDLFLLRLERYWGDLIEGLRLPYGEALVDLVPRLVDLLADRYRERPEDLRLLDIRRGLRPDDFQAPDQIGYVCYVDRFAGTMPAVLDHLDLLTDLGVRYLHLMPLLRGREGDDDGGYAVADYRAVDPALGTMDDLEALAQALRAQGISLCIDLVLNHCAAEHAWARAAAAGDADAAAMFWIFPDRTLPDAYEASLPWVFPATAPGNFTPLPDGRWVWTTFHAYQWDLDWSSPRVLLEFVDILLSLAARGVEVFRLDAVAFMWKRLGTNCQGQPEVHHLVAALRACARIVAPAVRFKAEAIVGPDELAAYLGTGRLHGKVADLAYHNTLMVQIWSALATGDARLMDHVLRRFPAKPSTTAWATYVRCHDDIGWAITDVDAAAIGWDGPAHRAFLADFYAGRFAGSWSVGEDYQTDEATGDRRTSGALASLAGLETALERADPGAVDLAIRRILLAHAVIMAWDGIPLIYMGDEIGLRNDRGYRDDPDHAADSRWIHRPRMDWAAAARRHDPSTVEGRIFSGLLAIVAARRASPELHAGHPVEIVETGDTRLFAWLRRSPVGPLLAICNVTADLVAVDGDLVRGAIGSVVVDRLRPGRARSVKTLVLEAYEAVWLVPDD